MAQARTELPTVVARGEIDITSSRPLAVRLGELAGKPGDAILDLTEVTLLDSIGLGVVLKAVGRFQRQGKRLVLVAPPDGRVRSLLGFAGVEGRVEVVDDHAAAVAALDG
jgi:anti-anti-sigma factor